MKVDGHIATLFTCEYHLSPLVNTDKCYNMIPVAFKGLTQFVYPNTRQTALRGKMQEQLYSLNADFPFQRSISKATVWYTLQPQPIPCNPPPLTFEPHKISQSIEYDSKINSQNLGIYSQKDVLQLVHAMIIGKRVEAILQTLVQSAEVDEIAEMYPGTSHINYQGGYTRNVYFDNMISANWLHSY